MQDSLTTPVTDSLEAIYQEHGQRLWRALLGYSGDPDIASDAVSEAFAQALRRGDEIRSALPWIWRAAFRVAAGELKSRGQHAQLPAEGIGEAPSEADELLSSLSALSLKQRGALVLHYYAGYPPRDIARILGSTPAAVRVHLHRGRRRLRELLEEDDA